jgi:tRNA(adenine34) deaminase
LLPLVLEAFVLGGIFLEEAFMKHALHQARLAGHKGEVPVGCIIVYQGEIIASGRNRRETDQNALAHAELEAIQTACKRMKSWRLVDCDLYVTLEPCPMCAGAIVNARIARVFYGASDSKAGAFGSVFDLTQFPLNHIPEIHSGILAQESSELLQTFFQTLRKRGD